MEMLSEPEESDVGKQMRDKLLSNRRSGRFASTRSLRADYRTP